MSRGVGAASVLAMLVIAGCTTSMGALSTPSDSVVGGYYGNRVANDGEKAAAAIVGGMAGGIAAGETGAALGRTDRRHALEAEYQALEYTPGGKPVTWSSGDGSRRGEVIAAQPYRVGSQDCRQYSHTIYVDGRATTGKGTACRNGDGSWTLLS